MQAERYLFNSHIEGSYQKMRQSKKFSQMESIMSLLRDMNIPEMGAFMVGYVIGELGIGIDDKENKKLIAKVGQSLDLVREGIIQHRSLVGGILETMDRVKKMKETNSNSPKRLPEQKNKMRSQQERIKDNSNNINSYFQPQQSNLNSNKQSPTSYFITILQSLLSQMACDPDYLQNLWHAQQYQQQQQQQSRQMIDKIIAQQSQKRDLEENKKLQCQICLVDIDFSQMAPLGGCKHIFHIACIHQHIKSSINSNIIEIKCPMEECKNYLSVDEIQSYIDGDLMEKYYKFSLNKYVQSGNNMTSWCPTAGCSAVFQYDEALDNYRCPVCRKHYCLKCRTDYHYGMTCAEYRISKTFSDDDKKFVDFVKGAKFKQCPKCKFWVERVAGCSSMACRCGIEFCYDCGGTGCPHGRCIDSGRMK